MEIFVPGRICLFGEHSDWAGGYRRINAEIETGSTLITGTNQGIYARIKAHSNKLILHSTRQSADSEEHIEIPMERSALLSVAQEGGYFSYSAGVAYQILTHYHVRGLEIDNYKTDLPVKKGLSSSAAICVLVARAFNRIYDLKMTIRGEMEFAYLGEITTPSRCGRMDQGCAYGNRPINMIFDGDRIDIQEINTPKELYFVIVDLQSSKNTKEILSKLNQSFPFADSEIQSGVQKYLGPINQKIVRQAISAIQKGDAKTIGKLMTEAQQAFDKYLQPACPSQLTAPVLHKVLNHESLKPYIYGGKGVGSQGDGSAQFIVKDEASQQALIQIVAKKLGLTGLKLTIKPAQKVRKAVIPAAGFSTRMFPASKAIKKELFPIIDKYGKAKPALILIIEEALSAGIEDIAIIIQSSDLNTFRDYFEKPPRIENYNKLSQEDKKYWAYINETSTRITFISQETQDGFGHAVFCARDWVGREPFLLMLGDHLYATEDETPCAKQIINIYEKTNNSVVGLKQTPISEIYKFGCVAGNWITNSDILSITQFAEKPDINYARENLVTDRIEKDHFLTIFGQYILTPKIFEFLEEHIHHNLREGGEFQLTSCLDRLRQTEGFYGYVVKGKRFDIGTPDGYRKTIIEYPTT